MSYLRHSYKFRQRETKRILLASPPADWRRQPGRPRIPWLSTVQQDLKQHHLMLPESADLAQNRPLWRMMSTYGATQSWGPFIATQLNSTGRRVELCRYRRAFRVARQKRRRRRRLVIYHVGLSVILSACLCAASRKTLCMDLRVIFFTKGRSCPSLKVISFWRWSRLTFTVV